jgi:hypothetical protein
MKRKKDLPRLATVFGDVLGMLIALPSEAVVAASAAV